MRAQVMAKALEHFRFKLKDHFFILIGLVLAVGLLSIRLQLYMPLGRYQHYGLCIFCFGLGYVVQLIWSWSHLKRWPRAGYAVTALYLTSMGIVLYSNPWLDVKVAVMTEDKENLKALIGWVYTILGLPLAYIYIEWMQEDYRIFKKKGSKH